MDAGSLAPGLLNLFSTLIDLPALVKQVTANGGAAMKKRVKMVDVARAAHVSKTTVSLVLNQIPGVRIAEDTRQRVLRVARELGYEPGPDLHQIDPDRKRLYGVLINEISAAYPINLIEGMQIWADAQGVQVVIQVTGAIPDHETAALENFARFGVDGVIYARTFTAIVEPPPKLEAFRHVFLNCRRADGVGVAVLPAERSGGTLATEHLIGLGRKRIATITGDPWQLAAKERLEGYHRALARAGLSRDGALELNGDWGHESGYAATIRLLELPDPPDAIFCQNDIMARGALAALRAHGRSVPAEVAVIGYDDREFAKTLEPTLTSVTLPHVEMAERAIQYLAAGTPSGDRTVSIRGELILRQSSGG